MPKNYDHPGVYIEEIAMPKTIEGVPTSIAAFIGRTIGGADGVAVLCRSFHDFVDAFAGQHNDSEIGDSVNLFFENGGTECYVVRLKDDAPDINAALAGLEKIDLINLIVIPRDAGISSEDQRTMLIAASEYCRSRRAFLIADAPANWQGDVNKFPVDDFREGFARENTAVYYPRLKIGDVKDLKTIGASGAIAGLYARTDAERGVWKAPAGTEADLRGILGVDVALRDAENGSLNSRGINCIRAFPTHGTVAWGARTLDGDDQFASDWKYVNIRRLTLYIMESIYRGTQWAVFEPNGEKLWADLRQMTGDFMHNLWRSGAFMGVTATEAYFVSCDQTTMTQDDIDNGRINIMIGFAPVRPAEFVVIYINQMAIRND